MNDFMDVRRVVMMILRRSWILIVLMLLGAMVGYAISRQQTPVYKATTTILVGESIKSSNVDRVDIQISEALIQTYVEIARRQPVLQGVVTTLNLNETWQELQDRISVKPIDSTQLIEISVEANHPELAEMIADEVVNQLILLSPSTLESAENQLASNFNREQIAKLQDRILSGQQRLGEIEAAINNSASEIELAALQQEKTTLEGWLIEWERNYAQLAALSEPKRNPTQLTIVEPAHSDFRIVRPRIQLNTILGGVLGMVLALGLIFLLDFLDDTYRSVRDFSDAQRINILGSIRKFRARRPADRLIAHLYPHSPITETYRIIRSRVRFKRVEQARTIMIASSMPGEGKSVTAANMAVVFAQTNLKTIVVDADFRKPSLHEIFSCENSRGFGDLLDSRDLQLQDCLQTTPVKNLRILSSGLNPPDPSTQLSSERCKQIIATLKETADVVIFDTPPLLLFADAIILSRRMDGVIMVVQAGKSRRNAINQAISDLQNANANVLGSIFNQSPKSDTFTVNKAYMQDRPQGPSAWTWLNRDSILNSLRESAAPLINRQNATPDREAQHVEALAPAAETTRPMTPAPVSPKFEISVSDNGGRETMVKIVSNADTPSNNDNHRQPIESRELDTALEEARAMLIDLDEDADGSSLPRANVTDEEKSLLLEAAEPSGGRDVTRAEEVDESAQAENEDTVLEEDGKEMTKSRKARRAAHEKALETEAVDTEAEGVVAENSSQEES